MTQRCSELTDTLWTTLSVFCGSPNTNNVIFRDRSLCKSAETNKLCLCEAKRLDVRAVSTVLSLCSHPGIVQVMTKSAYHTQQLRESIHECVCACMRVW